MTFLMWAYGIPLTLGILCCFMAAILDGHSTTRKELLQLLGISFIPVLNWMIVVGAIIVTLTSKEVTDWLNKPVKSAPAPKNNIDEVA